jgi:hypothetical protein
LLLVCLGQSLVAGLLKSAFLLLLRLAAAFVARLAWHLAFSTGPGRYARLSVQLATAQRLVCRLDVGAALVTQAKKNPVPLGGTGFSGSPHPTLRVDLSHVDAGEVRVISHVDVGEEAQSSRKLRSCSEREG